jgi:diguanylate cyclase (GGDEF)-like protein/PAS domain S-box-containing protein
MAVTLDDAPTQPSGKRPIGRLLLLPLGLVVGGVAAAALWLVLANVLVPAGFGAQVALVGPPGGRGQLLPWLGAIGLCAASGVAAVVIMARHMQREIGQSASADELFEDVAYAGAAFIWQADPTGRLTSLSDGFERYSGRPRGTAIGRGWDEVPGLTLAEPARRAVGMAIASARAFRDIEAELSAPEGEKRYIRLIARPFFDAEGRLEGYRGAGIDISDVVRTREKLEFVDRHDRLTGMLNRSGAIQALKKFLGRGRQASERPVLMVINIDRFRGINEAFGAAAGDMVIQQVAERLRVCAREGDLLGRLSADEFMLLRPSALPFDTLADLTSRLERTLDERFDVADDNHLKVSCHLGVYEIGHEDRDDETCLRRAQLAVGRARQDGRFTRLFMDGMDLEAEAIRRLEEELRQAIDKRRLALVYQPQLDLKSGRYIGAEALMRWHHKDHGFVSPARFIPLAERTGLVVELSRWALRQACLDSRRLGDFRVAVNLSPIDLAAPDCVEHLESLLHETEMDPGRLELEITEGVLIEDTEGTLDVLLRLKRLGLRIALDDFGTGYAGLGYLQIFPFDKLKIDQSFIRRIARSGHAAAIVRSVVALAHELDLTVCAEGVETKDQLQLLMAEGCDVVQGYFSGQPMSAKQLQQLVERQSTMLAEAGASRAAAAFADPLPTIARAAIEHGANTD